ncbi:VOC family protein [Pseudonocardia xishanensis]|uniref:VOC family protein n=1 Tax=Pseudonocardia xishanensis TaxID=630995 RepID=A0ABP8RI16_9PSEU
MTTIQPILITADLARLLRFYTELLGAKEVRRTPAEGEPFFVGIEVGGAELGFVNDADAPTAQGRIVLSIDVADVDALLPRVAELGGTASEPNDMPWGQRVAHIQDPDGNAVNLTRTLSS